jgi:hypothetical protein
MKSFKLSIELVPSSAWNQNLRLALPKGAWEKIRKEVFEKSDNKCVICGKIGKLNCHEVWEYDNKNHVQKLAGFLALCSLCHAVKHLGFAGLAVSKHQGPAFEKLVKHFMKVNNCSRQDFLNHQKEAYQKFEQRSHFEWSLDLNANHNKNVG